MDPKPQWDDSSARAFYLDQLKTVRAEADKLGDETRVTERYVLGACGGIYTFLFAHWNQLKTLPYTLISWIPLLLAIWGGLRSKALYTRIQQCGLYIKGAENALRISEWQGWEHWLTAPERNDHVVANSAKTIWWSLIIFTTALAITATLVCCLKT